jgi:TolA-binding protein
MPGVGGFLTGVRLVLRSGGLLWRSLRMVLMSVACLASVHAAEPLNRPVPLQDRATMASAGRTGATLAAAQRAQELGLPTVAVALYQELLAVPGADRAALSLPLATALLDAGRAAEAEQVLNASPGPRSPEWRLRLGLAAAQQKRFATAADQLRQINVDQLTRPDRAWFWFLQAIVADTSVPRDTAYANEHYRRAEQEAPNDLARATFLAAGERVRLGLVTYSPAEVEGIRRYYEQEQQRGRSAYQAAEDYAIARDATGGKTEAVRFLSDVILRIPRGEQEWLDRFRLHLGFIGDRGRGGAGRNALSQLLEQGRTPDRQRQTLQLLAEASTRDPERGLFRAQLDRVIAATPKTQILDAVLLMRAQLALGDKDFGMAERSASELIGNYPGSALRPHAQVVLATSAWEQQRYRLAAENARLAREALAATPAASAPTEAKVVAQSIGELRVLEAEARFRAGDFRLAADAYAAAVREPPAGIGASQLMFQRALASISADANDRNADLTKIVDELERDPRFDPEDRWEAEWSLARGLKVQGKVDAALARVRRLLDSDRSTAGIPPELRARMAWLEVHLSIEANRPELTLQLVPRLDTALAGVPAALKTQIASTAALWKAEAEFRSGREKAALQTLSALRADYPDSDAAVQSYLVAANYYSERDQIQEAQRALQVLVDEPRYRSSQYVADALYQLALLSERLGQTDNLREANRRIEDLVSRDPAPPPELVFQARLKQGDLLRQLNDFPRAQIAYEDLVNNPKYAQRPDVVVAQLRLAQCHNAQSSTDPSGSHADTALAMFEELLYRVTAPADVRAEAGYNLGKMLERRGQFEKARNVWFADVVKPFLLDLKPGEIMRATEPYWLVRTVLDLGELLEQRENIDEARRVYVILRDSRLSGAESVANERLQRLGIPVTAAGAASGSPADR